MLNGGVVVFARYTGNDLKEPGMRLTEMAEGAVRADGVVVNVDSVSRELTVRFTDGMRQIDVPPGCPITLRGERVRLRLVQARDHVRVTYVECHNSRVASSIEIRSGPRLPGPPARIDGKKSLPPNSSGSHPSRPVGGSVPIGQ
jgi:hypothetical protein